MTRTHIAIASIAAAVAATAIILPAGAGGDKIAFPADYAKGALYTTVDRPDNKQYRELYVSPASALEAAKKGDPLPSGTVDRNARSNPSIAWPVAESACVRPCT